MRKRVYQALKLPIAFSATDRPDLLNSPRMVFFIAYCFVIPRRIAFFPADCVTFVIIGVMLPVVRPPSAPNTPPTKASLPALEIVEACLGVVVIAAVPQRVYIADGGVAALRTAGCFHRRNAPRVIAVPCDDCAARVHQRDHIALHVQLTTSVD